MYKSVGKTRLQSISLGSASTCDLRGHTLTVRLLGILPVQTIHLSDVNYLRLATRDEFSMAYLVLNWQHFLPHRRCVQPHYVLQTNFRRRIFLKLDGRTHFMLRQAIARAHGHHQWMAA